MKFYETPEINIILLDSDDIMTQSGNEDDEDTGYNGEWQGPMVPAP